MNERLGRRIRIVVDQVFGARDRAGHRQEHVGMGQVRLRIGDQRLTAIITSDALSALKLRRGDSALAIVKATEVMIAREAEPAARPLKRRRQRR